ncbi:MAG: hypothetical protein ABJL67_13495 [Sulfitobacter sp.]
MSEIFDGIAGQLNNLFGSPVQHARNGGTAVTIQARFRRTPIEILEEDGNYVLLNSPTLRVPEPVASSIAVGDQITPDNGVIYDVLSRHDSGSPAVDAFVIFKLREA